MNARRPSPVNEAASPQLPKLAQPIGAPRLVLDVNAIRNEVSDRGIEWAALEIYRLRCALAAALKKAAEDQQR